MTTKCSNCNRYIQTRIILCCTCGSFCDRKCQDEYHQKSRKGKKPIMRFDGQGGYFPIEDKKLEIITNSEIEFLNESNKIEREYSDEALQSAIKSWKYAKKNCREFSLDYILNIHKLLAEKLNKRIAGKIRECAVMIGGETRDQSREQIVVELQAWLEHQFTRETEEGIIQSHIVFEHIHPFEDGNGRVGRILMNIQRINAGLPIVIIHEGEEQFKYYKWFKRVKEKK